ncbi:MAG: hypothetical protein AAGE52_01830 [Myxococcota bacterium]
MRALVSLLVLAACGDDDSATDAAVDAAADAAVDTARERDAGEDAGVDAGDVGSDARANNDAGSDAGPAGRVAFVAVGWGGRRLVSCDDGRTWSGDIEEAPESEDDWHRSYTPKSLAFGEGAFLFLTGWGTNSTIWRSEDGSAWTDVALETSYGALGFIGDRFVAVGNRVVSDSYDGGRTWVDREDAAARHDRAGGAFPGVLASGADGEVEFDRGEGWTLLESCVGARHGHIGFEGGFAVGNGTLVSVGHDGDTCALDLESGADLGAGSVGAATPGPPTFADGRFVVATGAQLLRSTNGLTWTSEDLPEGVRFELVARGSNGTWVGISQSGDRFFYSDDGRAWSTGSGPEGNGVLYVTSGVLERCGG